MCKVTNYIGEKDFSHLYDIVLSQQKYYDKMKYWQQCCLLHQKQFAIWERIGGSANGDYGNVGINFLCFHRHLNLSNHTSPYLIIKEIREYISSKIGADVFYEWKFEQWEKQFYGGRFTNVSHKFQSLL